MTIATRYDPLVHDAKLVFMQRLADHVRRGYRYFVLGGVSPSRARVLAAKFGRLYEVNLHRNHRARLRTHGEASAYCLWWQPHAETLVFALLLSSGTHAMRQLENMKDASTKEGRLRLGDYELVQRPRSGQPRPSWTWRLTSEAYEGWRARVLEVVRNGNEFDVSQLVSDLLGTPGFAGVREQVKRLKQLLRSEWRRRRGDAPAPALPRQRFVQRLKNRGNRLSFLTAKCQPNVATTLPSDAST